MVMPNKVVEAKVAARAGTQEGQRPTVVSAPAATNPELVERPRRRTFTAQEKLRILEETDRASRTGDIGVILRREGGLLVVADRLAPPARCRCLRGPDAGQERHEGGPGQPVEAELTSARREITQLGQRLERAEAIIDLQKNYPPCWESRCQRRTATEHRDGRGYRIGARRRPHRRL